MAYLDDLKDGLYDQMVDMLVYNELRYDEEFREQADENGFDFEEMLREAADRIKESEAEIW